MIATPLIKKLYGYTVLCLSAEQLEKPLLAWGKKTSQQVGVVLVGFNINEVVFRNIFFLSAWVMLGFIIGVKTFADYESVIGEWIS